MLNFSSLCRCYCLLPSCQGVCFTGKTLATPTWSHTHRHEGVLWAGPKCPLSHAEPAPDTQTLLSWWSFQSHGSSGLSSALLFFEFCSGHQTGHSAPMKPGGCWPEGITLALLPAPWIGEKIDTSLWGQWCRSQSSEGVCWCCQATLHHISEVMVVRGIPIYLEKKEASLLFLNSGERKTQGATGRPVSFTAASPQENCPCPSGGSLWWSDCNGQQEKTDQCHPPGIL